MTSVLITGAGGFIGQRLVAAAESQGCRVFRVARRPLPGCSLIRDLRSPWQGLPAVDWVFHLAGGYAGAGLRTLEESDIRMARNLVDWSGEVGVRKWVVASAAEVYGVCKGVANEQAPTRPAVPYGVVKLRMERMISEWAGRRPDARLVILRIGEVYGPGGRLVDELTRRLRSGFCPWFGSGAVPVSFVHVDDVAGTILAAADQARTGISLWNVADDQPVEWRDFLAGFAELLSARKPVSLPRMLGSLYACLSEGAARIHGRSPVVTREIMRLLTTPKAMSNEKIKRDLKYRFAYPDFRSGLAEILAAGI